MEFIQKKTVDSAVEPFLPKAADEQVSLVWDRYEGQLPECGFCETGLSCRDCLQGPCISHPFRESSKLGVCGKDKDILASQSLLRLVLKGTMGALDQVSDFASGVESGEVTPKNKGQAEKTVKRIRRLLSGGDGDERKELPRTLIESWEAAGIRPEGIARDLFKASQKLEGGIAGVEDTLLWAFKASLLGCLAQRLQGRLKRSVFGETVPTQLGVNLGVLRKETANIVLYGCFSPILKRKIAEVASKKKIAVLGVCTDPLLPPYSFPPVTSYGSQEIPVMTGAVDLIVAGDRFVNPSLAKLSREWQTAVVSTDGLKREQDPGRFARQIVEKAKQASEFRRRIPRHVPEAIEYAVLGFSAETVGLEKIVEAMTRGKIKGIAIFSGSNNVKCTQDQETVSMATELLKNDVLCISEGEASVSLAKYGLLNPVQQGQLCGKGLLDLLASLGKKYPPVLDFGGSENGGVTEFLLAIASVGKHALKDCPIVACFPEASRSTEVAEALWTVAMGVSTYFWPCLPVAGSPKTMEALTQGCMEKFGAALHVSTEKRLSPEAKAKMILRELSGEVSPLLHDHQWGQA
jgi:carbon-monoxide dehydrogenase catalytic subunit